jgi:hypothetical protein
MADNGRKNDTTREQAATLLAEGDKTFAEIAKLCGIGDRTLFRWQTEPGFKARIEEIKTINSERTVQDGIARKDNRLSIYQDLANRMQMIIAGRSEGMDGEGCASGLLARSYDKTGREMFKFDAALVRELNNTLKQAAIEKGQWTEKAEVDIGGEVKIIKVPAKLSHDEWSAEQWEQPEKAS